MTAKPETEVLATIHVAGPIEHLPTGAVDEEIAVQRCLRCDFLLGSSGPGALGATWAVGTRIGVLTSAQGNRRYILDRKGYRAGETDCVDRIGWR